MKNTVLRSLQVAVAAAALGLGGFAAAQPAAGQQGHGQNMHKQGHHKHHREHRGHHRVDRAEHMKQRLDKLKAELNLSAAQTGAWDSYLAAMKPAERPARMERGDFAKLTTPERIDKMRELRTQRHADMDRRGDATKAFYAQLNADQQKTFDKTSQRMHGHAGPRHGHAHHRHGGQPGQDRPAPDAKAQ